MNTKKSISIFSILLALFVTFLSLMLVGCKDEKPTMSKEEAQLMNSQLQEQKLEAYSKEALKFYKKEKNVETSVKDMSYDIRKGEYGTTINYQTMYFTMEDDTVVVYDKTTNLFKFK